MIFYFSATGNSKYAAERIAAATDDRLIFLRDAIRGRSYRYEVGREERIGFVAPTYFFGLPSILNFFLEKLQLSGYQDQYVYLVLTCGGSTGNAAEEYIDEARRAIRARGLGDYNRCKGSAPAVMTAAAYPLYAHGRSTRPFVVTDQCIGCGLCQEICPCGAITLSGGQPVWAKRTCVQCLGCLHRCPVEAIHWKKADEERGRYYNPRVEP